LGKLKLITRFIVKMCNEKNIAFNREIFINRLIEKAADCLID